MVADVRIRESKNAERRLLQTYSLELDYHDFHLENPRLRARVIEPGSGQPQRRLTVGDRHEP